VVFRLQRIYQWQAYNVYEIKIKEIENEEMVEGSGGGYSDGCNRGIVFGVRRFAGGFAEANGGAG